MPNVERVNFNEAKSRFSKLCRLAARGREVIVARRGRPWVRITAVDPARKGVRFGVMMGEIRLADDFDAPLPHDLQQAFEGR